MVPEARLAAIMQEQPYPLLFAVVSGAHLYGFPSQDSDYDLRGAHIIPQRAALGLESPPETLNFERIIDGLEIDLVTHDIKMYFQLLLRQDGNVFEQLYSPLVLQTSAEHQALKSVAHGCLTKRHGHHYLGYAQGQWKLFLKEDPHRVKPLLYVYRTLLTGIYLMRAGRVEANLPRLNETFGLSYISDLIAQKLAGPEQAVLSAADLPFYESEYARLLTELEVARDATTLPETPTTRDALNDLLIEIRLKQPVG